MSVVMQSQQHRHLITHPLQIEAWTEASVTQLLVELHYRDEGSLFHFMRGMHAHGFRAFRREANVLDVQRCWEYAFVRVPGLGAGEAASREGEWAAGGISDEPTEATRRAAGATGDLRSYLADCRLSEDIKYRKAAEWFTSL